jgi:predicted nucleic acid-binding protein
MAIICDTSGIYALYDGDDAQHQRTTALVASESGPLLIPVILLAEIDYLLLTDSELTRPSSLSRTWKRVCIHWSLCLPWTSCGPASC